MKSFVSVTLLEKSMPVDSFNSNSFFSFEVHEHKEKMHKTVTEKQNLRHIVVKQKKAISLKWPLKFISNSWINYYIPGFESG